MTVLNMILTLLCCFLLCSHVSCFLLQSTPSTSITDKHYNLLFDLLVEERQARRNLEFSLTRDFTRLQEDVAKLKQCGCANSVIQMSASIDINNRTEAIENDLRNAVNELQTLKSKYASLEMDLTRASAKTVELEKELNVLKGLEIFADISSVANLQNQTNDVSIELYKIQEKQSGLISDANARKQDFIALYKKLQETEGSVQITNEKLGNVTETVKSAISYINSTVFDVLKVDLDSLEKKLGYQNISISSILNNYTPVFAASLTKGKSYNENEIVKFDKVWTNTGNGYNPATGKFTAPATGTYYFSCTIMKLANAVRVFLMHNSQRTMSIYAGANVSAEGGTLNIALALTQGDQAYIQVHINAELIHSEPSSTMTHFSGFML